MWMVVMSYTCLVFILSISACVLKSMKESNDISLDLVASDLTQGVGSQGTRIGGGGPVVWLLRQTWSHEPASPSRGSREVICEWKR